MNRRTFILLYFQTVEVWLTGRRLLDIVEELRRIERRQLIG